MNYYQFDATMTTARMRARQLQSLLVLQKAHPTDDKLPEQVAEARKQFSISRKELGALMREDLELPDANV